MFVKESNIHIFVYYDAWLICRLYLPYFCQSLFSINIVGEYTLGIYSCSVPSIVFSHTVSIDAFCIKFMKLTT
jgi:hypothetical protein